VANEELQNLLRTGIQAAQSGNKALARGILKQVVDQDPRNELGWIWLASVLDAAAERRTALQKVLEINPNNTRAKQALDKLTPASTATAANITPPLSVSARPTPHLAEPSPRASREAQRAQLEREVLLAVHARRQRRMSPVTFIILGLLAVAMIALGAVLLVDMLNDDEGEEKTVTTANQTTPTVTMTQAGAATPLGGYASPTPIGGVLRTVPPKSTLPPTWTPLPTATLRATDTPVPTLPPLTEYNLLVAARQDEQDSWALYTISADGSGKTRVPIRLSAQQDDLQATAEAMEPELVEVMDAAYSPDSEQIVFTARLRTGNTEYEDLYTASSNGGVMERLTTLEADHVGGAVWSPDGKRIVFASDAGGDFDVYIIDITGDNLLPITFEDGIDRDPAWSPDGQFIVFASDRNSPGFPEIWRITPDGAYPTQLTDNTNSSYSPAWSPDGQWIAFISDRNGDADLFVMNAEGLGTLQESLMPPGIVSEECDPSWSPDSQWIAFCSNRDSSVFDLYLVRPNGSQMQALITGQDGDTRYSVWKP